ncbi:hypothetical protein JM93_00183 [Roseibium hamelinense]|uniref:Uncharacterized protein n=1 Tax=Roseibium hamelinense TaxID=150831 RepID=A0A562TJ05_9HYPH|nr:hypothetical protein [Roseibium hamelinense]MTI46168.1 hypothetical protein [Roseibium hamelinense]TWI92640.1 hypothetical protein JM93_00183 [Roseibium hamelinense]
MSEQIFLFTAMEWTLLVMAAGLTTALALYVKPPEKGSPFCPRQESWFRDEAEPQSGRDTALQNPDRKT